MTDSMGSTMGSGRPASATTADRLLDPALAANALVAYAFLYVPIGVLLLFSFSASRYSSVWGGFSLRWYVKLFENEEIARALWNSLRIAFGVASVSTVLGALVALGLDRAISGRRAAWYDSALTMPILVPDIVHGISLLLFFVMVFQGIERLLGWRPSLGATTVMLAHTTFCISYVAVVVRARLAGMSRTLEEAAMDLGANEWQVLRCVVFPLIWPAVLGGWLLAFTLSLDEFVITFFTTGPGATTLPIQVWSMVRRGVTPEVNALSSLILLFSVVGIALSLLLQRKRG